MLVFVLPPVFPNITVLLETAAFEAVRQGDADGVDNEAGALESVTLKVMFWFVVFEKRPRPAYQVSWYLCGNGRHFDTLWLVPVLAPLGDTGDLEPSIWALEEPEQEPAVFQNSLFFCLSFQRRCFFRYRVITVFRFT